MFDFASVWILILLSNAVGFYYNINLVELNVKLFVIIWNNLLTLAHPLLQSQTCQAVYQKISDVCNEPKIAEIIRQTKLLKLFSKINYLKNQVWQAITSTSRETCHQAILTNDDMKTSDATKATQATLEVDANNSNETNENLIHPYNTRQPYRNHYSYK